MANINTYQEIREKILNQSSTSYGKLLDPVQVAFNYNIDDLKLYLEYSQVLCKVIIQKLKSLTDVRGIYYQIYDTKTLNVITLLEKTAYKLNILETKIHKIEKDAQQAAEEEIIYNMWPVTLEDSNKCKEIDKNGDDISSNWDLKSSQSWEDSTDDESKHWETLNFTKICDDKTNLTSTDIPFENANFDALAYVKIIEAIHKVGISPTALSIEILIKVLLKMEFTLNSLLNCPSNYDYIELFYRADYLKSFEELLHETAKNSGDSIIYLS